MSDMEKEMMEEMMGEEMGAGEAVGRARCYYRREFYGDEAWEVCARAPGSPALCALPTLSSLCAVWRVLLVRDAGLDPEAQEDELPEDG